MAQNLIETARQYIASNGGHTTVAPTIGITAVLSADICAGRRPPTAQFAAGMASLLGVTAAQILKENVDYQFLTRRDSVG